MESTWRRSRPAGTLMVARKRAVCNAVPSPASGLTMCTGSHGVRVDEELAQSAVLCDWCPYRQALGTRPLSENRRRLSNAFLRISSTWACSVAAMNLSRIRESRVTFRRFARRSSIALKIAYVRYLPPGAERQSRLKSSICQWLRKVFFAGNVYFLWRRNRSFELLVIRSCAALLQIRQVRARRVQQLLIPGFRPAKFLSAATAWPSPLCYRYRVTTAARALRRENSRKSFGGCITPVFA